MAEGPRRLDGYLSELRARLRNLPDAEASEILEELRSHVCDSVGTGGELTESGVAAALRRLGSPAEAGVALRDGQPARAGRAQPVAMAALVEPLPLGLRQRRRRFRPPRQALGRRPGTSSPRGGPSGTGRAGVR